MAGGDPYAQISWVGTPQPDTIQITAPADLSTVNTVAVSGTEGLGDDLLVLVEARRPNGGFSSRGTAAVDMVTGNWSLPGAFATDGSDDGDWVVRATQTQGGGNIYRHEILFTLDTVKPVLALNQPADGSADDELKPTFSGTTDTLTTLVAITITGPSPAGTLRIITDSPNTGGVYAAAPPTNLPEGFYTAVAEQTDAAGNTTTTAPVSFQVDNTDPIVSISNPNQGGFENVKRPTVSGQAGIQPGDRDPTIKICPGTNLSCASAPFTATRGPSGSYAQAPPSDLTPDGTYTVGVTQTDNAGNSSATVTRTFTVDTVGPSLSAMTSPPASPPISDDTPLFAGKGGTHPNDGASVTVKVYAGATATGTPVRTLADDVDGNDDYSVAVPDQLSLDDGTYTAVAEQSDQAGNPGQSPARTFVIDTAAPVPQVDAPLDGAQVIDAVVSGTAGTASGDATDKVQIEVHEGASATGDLFLSVPTTIGAGGAFSANVPLPEGVFTVRVAQSDAASNLGKSTPPVTFTVDRTPPKVELLEFTSGKITGEPQPTFEGTAEQGSVVVEVFAGTDVSVPPVAAVAGTPVAGSYAITLTDPLPDGAYTARARQRDLAGNVGLSGLFSFSVDTAPPDVALTTPSAGAVLGDETPQLSGTAEPGPVTVELFQGGTASGPPDRSYDTTADAAGAFSVTVDVGLPDDQWTARANQTDRGGNIGESNSVPFVIDTGPPVVTLQAPGENGATTDATPELTGTAEEGAVTIAIHAGSSVGSSPLRTLGTNARADGRYAVAPQPALADGIYTAVAEQVDAAGNEGASAAVQFVVDATAPSLLLNTPRDDAFLATNRPPIGGVAGIADRDSDVIQVVMSGPVTVTMDARRTATGEFATISPQPAARRPVRDPRHAARFARQHRDGHGGRRHARHQAAVGDHQHRPGADRRRHPQRQHRVRRRRGRPVRVSLRRRADARGVRDAAATAAAERRRARARGDRDRRRGQPRSDPARAPVHDRRRAAQHDARAAGGGDEPAPPVDAADLSRLAEPRPVRRHGDAGRRRQAGWSRSRSSSRSCSGGGRTCRVS